jgi:hypothetical protein
MCVYITASSIANVLMVGLDLRYFASLAQPRKSATTRAPSARRRLSAETTKSRRRRPPLRRWRECVRLVEVPSPVLLCCSLLVLLFHYTRGARIHAYPILHVWLVSCITTTLKPTRQHDQQANNPTSPTKGESRGIYMPPLTCLPVTLSLRISILF